MYAHMSCSTQNPLACVDMDRFQHVQRACSTHIDDAISTLTQFATPDVAGDLGTATAAMCADTRLDAAMRAAFRASGQAIQLIRCVLYADPGLYKFVTHFSWAQVRNVFCSSDDVGVDDDDASGARAGRLALGARLGIGALFMCVPWLLVKYKNPLVKIHRWRVLTALWWVALLTTVICSGGTLSAETVGATRLEDYYYRDDVTRCAFDVLEQVPGAVFSNRIVNVAAPASLALDAFHAVTRTSVLNASLADMCGFCDLTVMDAAGHTPANVTMHLVTEDALRGGTPAAEWGSGGRDTDDGDDLVVFSLALPSFVHASWVRELMRALPQHMPPRAMWLNTEQLQADVQDTVTRESNLSVYSALCVSAILLCGVYRPGRGACGSVALSSLVLVTLGLGLLLAQRLAALVGVPSSPYNMMIAPIVLGNGVDSVLIMLAARDRGHHKWAVRSCPSIVASQLSTLCSFGIGLVFRVAHFYHFFVFSIVGLAVSCALQITMFPALITVCTTSRKGTAPPTLSPRAWWRVGCALSVVVAATGAFVLASYRPITLTFEMLTNLHEDTVSHRFFRDAVMNRADAVAPLTVLTRGIDDSVDWEGIRALPRLFNGSMVNNWHDTYVASGSASLDEWLSDPVAHVMYNRVISGERSAVTMLAPYRLQGDAWTDYEDLLRMHAMERATYCVASFERIGGYTIVQTYRHLWILLLASAALSTVASVAIAGWFGVAALFALGASYAATIGMIAAMRIHVHNMVVAALIILPGIVVDYVLHLTYSEDTLQAVVFSFLTGVGSFVPYMMSHTAGIRDFATVFVIGLCAGIVSACLAVAVKSARRYAPLALQTAKEADAAAPA